VRQQEVCRAGAVGSTQDGIELGRVVLQGQSQRAAGPVDNIQVCGDSPILVDQGLEYNRKRLVVGDPRSENVLDICYRGACGLSGLGLLLSLPVSKSMPLLDDLWFQVQIARECM
jgi:hypothetical protein